MARCSQASWLARMDMTYKLLVMCVLFGSLSIPVDTSCLTTEGGWNPYQCFKMLPDGDVLIEVGHDLELNCSVKEKDREALSAITEFPFTAHNLSIKRGFTELPEELFTVYEEEMTLQLRIPDAEAQSQFYTCYYQNVTGQPIKVTMKFVQVKKLPTIGKVECVSNNLINLSCYFHVEEGRDIAPMSWTMYYKYLPLEVTENKTICEVEEEVTEYYNRVCHVKDDYFRQFHIFEGKLKGIWQSSTAVALDPPVYTSAPFQFFTNFSIVKLFPVRNLQVFTSRSTNVTLMWAFPESIVVRNNTFYQIQTTSIWDNKTSMIQRSTNVTKFMVDGLVPDTNYTARVRCRLEDTKDTEMFWSNWTDVTFTTAQDVPFQPVTIAAFMYETINCDSNRLCLVIYWQNPSKRWSNGPLTNYEITLHPDSILPSNNQSSATEVFGRRIMMLYDTQLPDTQTYVLQMKVATKIGYSDFSQPLIVPDLETGTQLQAEWVLVELDAHRKRVQVTWKAKPELSADIVNVTYFRCIVPAAERNTTSYKHCKEDVDWLTVPVQKDSGNGSHWWDWSDNQSDARYAVSLTTALGLSGGLKWEEYRYNSYNSAPESPMYMAKVMSDVPTEALNVTILYPTHYSSNGGRPEMYNVTYKEIENSIIPNCPKGGLTKSFPVNFTSHELRVRDLTAGSRYVLCVRSQNSAGQSDYGEPVIVKLDGESGSKTGYIVGTTIGIMAAVVIIIIVLVFCYRRTKKLKQTVDMNTQEFEKSYVKNSMSYNRISDKNQYVNLDFKNEVMEPADSDSGKGDSLQTGEEKANDVSEDRNSVCSQTSLPLPGYERLPENDYLCSDYDSVISQQIDLEGSNTGQPICIEEQDVESMPQTHGHDNPSFSAPSVMSVTNESEPSASVDSAHRENKSMSSECVEGTEPLYKDAKLDGDDAESVEIPHESSQHDHQDIEMCEQIEEENVSTFETASTSGKEGGLTGEADQSIESLKNGEFINKGINENRVITETLADSDYSDAAVISTNVDPEDVGIDEFEEEELPGYQHTVDFSYDTRAEPLAASDIEETGSGICGDYQDSVQAMNGYQTAHLIDMAENIDSGASERNQSPSLVQETGTLDEDVNKQQSDIIHDLIHDVPATYPINEQGTMHKEFKGDSDKPSSETIQSKLKPEIIKMHNSVSDDESELESYVEARTKEFSAVSN